MEADATIIIPIIVAGMGVWILINYRRFTDLLTNTQSKFWHSGKPLSKFEVAYGRITVILAGLIALLMGTYVTLKTLLGL